MAVLGRLIVSSAERLDLPDVLSIDSYAAGDWKYFIDTLVGETTPYVVKGFDVIDPAGAIGTQNCSINIADSAMYYPGSGAGSFFYGLPAGNPNALPLTPALIKNAINYVYVTFTTANTSEDSRAFWDPDANGGAGGEFTQEVNTESVIQVQINVSTGSFPENTVPIAIVVVGASVISSIEDARPMMFRLGSGGISPNPSSRFAWPALPNSTYERLETPITITSPSGQNPFQGGDKNLNSLKEWMDAVMTKLAELGGTQYWYEDTSTFSIVNIFHDALATTFKSKGQYIYSSSIPGQLTYTEDILVLSTSDPRRYIVRGVGSGGGNGVLSIPNENVAYIPLVRGQPINALNQAVAWTNSQNYVNTPNGSIGFFANLSQGDWITQVGDDPTKFLRVEQFYDSPNGGGSVTTAANAKSIILSGAYQGNSDTGLAAYDKGVYLTSDIVVQPRTNAAITASGGNFLWLVLRSDVTEGIASISTVALSGTITNATGGTATVVVTGHGLIDGDYITVTAPVAQAGTYSVDVIDANTFSFGTSDTTTGAFTANYGLLTTAATTNGYGLQLESADHGFESGETIIVASTTNYNGSYVVNYRTATQVQFAIAAPQATETSGTATLARMDVRTEEGITKIVQGSIIDIGEKDSKNIQSYVGMPSLASTSPSYFIPSGYNTFYGAANYNSGANDNLTLRAGQLTAMMADKAQDKTLKYLCTATSATNTMSGPAQVITFAPASSTLTILQPGSPGNAVVALPSSAPIISLSVNQSAYVYINRNSPTTPPITIADTVDVPVDENVVVIANRLSDNSVWLWNGARVVNSIPLIPTPGGLVKVTYYDPVSTALPTGTVIEDGITISAGSTVLFSALTSGTNNAVYMANGTGTSITGWTIQYVFSGMTVPTGADTVIIQEGNSFQDQIGKFNDTTWVFNDKVRYFNIDPVTGQYNYFEQNAIAVSTLNDNTTNGTITSYNYAGSEYSIIDFSIHRGTARDTGTIYVTSDGTNVDVAVGGAYINNSGVTFSGSIVSGVFHLLYTTTSTGATATMKFMVRRWSEGLGGPSGVPSYSGGGGGGGGTPGGSNENIQFNDGGTFGGSNNFNIDTTNPYIGVTGAIVLNGLNQSVLSAPVTLLDNMASPTPMITYPASTSYAVIEYSIVRDGDNRVGRLLVATNGSVSSESDDYVETDQFAPTGVTFTSAVVGPNVIVYYMTTSTGFNATLKYAGRSWS